MGGSWVCSRSAWQELPSGLLDSHCFLQTMEDRAWEYVFLPIFIHHFVSFLLSGRTGKHCSFYHWPALCPQ